MDFSQFWTKLQALEKQIAITSPAKPSVKAAYWGAPPKSVADLPCIINALSEPDRVLGFGSRDQRITITVQMLVARATTEDAQSSLLATAFWFAAKDAFDADYTIGNTVPMSTLRGADPTVPVLLFHAGQAYIGFSAVLDIRAVESFTF